MVKKKINPLTSIIKKHFSDLEKNQTEFIPGKSSIPLAIPPYGWEEVLDAIDSLLEMKTTMSKKSRSLIRVTLDSAERASKTVNQLMGKNAESRFKFIKERAVFVQDLDV